MRVNDTASMTINYMDQAQKTQEKAIAKISATRPVDGTDGASLAIADSLRTQSDTIDAGITNSYDAIGMLQIADSTLGTISQDASKLNVLSMRANSPVLNDAQKGMIHSEALALTDSINQSFQSSTFNGQNVFENINFVAGTGTQSVNASGLNTSGLDISNQNSITDFMDSLDSLRSDIGAGIDGISANINASIQNSISTRQAEAVQLPSDITKNYEELNKGYLKENAALFANAHNAAALQSKMASLLG